MKISKQARREAKDLFRNCVVDGLMDENRVRKSVEQVVAQKPRGYVAILSHFLRLVKLDLLRRTARVETAVPITPALQANVQNNLARSYGRGLIVSFHQNATLLGGMRVQVGGDVYDGSVAARLRELEQSF